MKRMIQYGVRSLDANGDVVDVDIYDTKAEALREAEAWQLREAGPLVNAEVGVVVEREAWRSRDFEAYGVERRDFETIYRRGVTAAWGK